MEDDNKQQTTTIIAVLDGSLLPTTEKRKKNKEHKGPIITAAATVYATEVHLLSSYVLYNAFVYGCFVAHSLYGDVTCDDQPSWWTWTSCYHLTGAAADEGTQLGLAMLWCCATQAVTAVIAMLLARCRCTRTTLTIAMAVASVALALATATHCLRARMDYLFLVAYPGDPLLIVDVLVTCFVVFQDLVGFVVVVVSTDEHHHLQLQSCRGVI